MTKRFLRGALGCGGFTLSEIATVLVLIAIMAAFSAPSFARALRESRAGRASAHLVSDLSEARAMAIQSGRGATVTFVGTSAYTVREGLSDLSTVHLSTDLSAEYGVSVRIEPSAPERVLAFDGRGEVLVGSGTILVLYRPLYGAERVDSVRVPSSGRIAAVR
jgi:prepilin-type N-terminal cleavage/methylation domain-containing protein